jgi:hypothetical protein
MRAAYSQARPPRWAEALLHLVLTPRDRESVSGDLLEEYRDAIVPARGPAAANRWYEIHVGSLLVRVSWRWGAVLGSALVIRYMFDTLAPVTDYRMRSTSIGYTIIGACLAASFFATWRTQSIRAGVLTSFCAATIGALLSIAGTAMMLAIWHDPATLAAWRSSGDLDEAFFDVPLVIMAVGAATGIAGALLAKGVATSVPRHEEKDDMTLETARTR